MYPTILFRLPIALQKSLPILSHRDSMSDKPLYPGRVPYRCHDIQVVYQEAAPARLQFPG